MTDERQGYGQAVAALRLLPFPPHEQLPDGKFSQTWSLTTNANVDERRLGQSAKAAELLGATISLSGSRSLTVRTSFTCDTASAEAVRRMQQIFALIQDRLAPLETIQGVEQSAWGWFTAEVLAQIGDLPP